MTTYPFENIPSGVAIADYFIETLGEHKGLNGDGLKLWRDGFDYCYLWVEAVVDHDLQYFWLIDVRTNINNVETRDFLFVTNGLYGGLGETEWFQRPVPAFGTSPEDHQVRWLEAMTWFSNRVASFHERVAAEA